MSFGFQIKAQSGDELRQKAAEEFAKVKAAQPVHEYDLPLIAAAVGSYIGLADEPADGKVLSLSVSGSIGLWDGVFNSANVSVGISFVNAD